MTHFTQIDKARFGEWAIVTGASSGIGAEFARQLAASGLNLVLVARRLPLLEALGKELSTQHQIQYRTLSLDLSDEDFLDTLDSATRDLDIGLVISNAGSGNPGAFLSHAQDTLLQIVNLNVIAHMRIAHHFGEKLKQRGRGGLLLVSAMGASQGLPYMSHDAATKAYIISLGEGLHIEFEKFGIHVSVLMPGPTQTPVLDAFGLDPATMPVKPMSVEQCVAEGLAAFKANRSSHLSGRMNRMMASLIPASITRRLLGRMIASGVEKRQVQVATS